MNDEKLLDEARKLMDKKNYRQALNLFSKITDSSLLCRAYINMGICYRRLKEFNKGIEILKKAIEINSKDPRAYANLGAVYSDTGEKELALEKSKKAYELCNDSAIAICNLLSDYLDLEQYDKIIEFEKIIQNEENLKTDELNKKKAPIAKDDIYRNMGRAHSNLGNYLKALEYFKKVKNKTGKTYSCIAGQYFILGRNGKSLLYYIISFLMRPCLYAMRYIFINLEHIFCRKKYTRLAALVAISINSHGYKAGIDVLFGIKDPYMLHCVLKNLNDYCKWYKDDKKVLGFIKKAIETDPACSPAYTSLADLYFDSGEKELALEFYKKAYDVSGGDLWATYKLMNTYIKLGQFDKIIEFDKKVKKGLKRNKLSKRKATELLDEIYRMAGEVHLKYENYREVIRCFELTKHKYCSDYWIIAAGYTALYWDFFEAADLEAICKLLGEKKEEDYEEEYDMLFNMIFAFFGILFSYFFVSKTYLYIGKTMMCLPYITKIRPYVQETRETVLNILETPIKIG